MSTRRRKEPGLTERSTRTGRALERGFTLIELLVVASILIVLAGIGLAQYRNSVIRAREAVLKEDLFRMRDAIDQYYADKMMYPSTLDALVTEGYMRRVPDDPFTMSSSTWQTVPSEPDPNNPSASPGVYDVKSGSEATALDSTRYADW
jgi:general secretion pathway protein G